MYKPMKSLLLFPLLLATAAIAQEPDSTSALFKMREAERNFARASVMIGRNAAFAENFAEESVLFTDRWITNGKKYSKERKASPVVLKWEPEFMDISASRDFGISTGPWEVQEYRPNTTPLFTGYFLTVWKRQPDGVWKVILDGGSTTPPANNKSHNFSYPVGADKAFPNPPSVRPEVLHKELLDREEEVLTEWKKSPDPTSYSSFLDSHARMQFNGHLPSSDIDTIKALISTLNKSMIWKTSGAGAASSGDLGFTYGLLEIPGEKKATVGHYVRIWKKHPGTSWKIFLEMLNLD
jgi:ketosteroid isomerase-like protein